MATVHDFQKLLTICFLQFLYTQMIPFYSTRDALSFLFENILREVRTKFSNIKQFFTERFSNEHRFNVLDGWSIYEKFETFPVDALRSDRLSITFMLN